MPKLKKVKRSSCLNRTTRYRQRKRGVQRAFKPGNDRVKGLQDYIDTNSFTISDVTDGGAGDGERADIYLQINNDINSIKTEELFNAYLEGFVGGLRYNITLKPNLVKLCCQLIDIDQTQLLTEGTHYPFFMKKKGSVPVHKDIDFFANKRINTAIIYLQTTGHGCLKLYDTGYTDLQSTLLMDIVQTNGMVIQFLSYLYHEVYVPDDQLILESREMIVLGYMVKDCPQPQENIKPTP